MLRSYRGIFVAVAGLALVGAGDAPKNATTAKQAETGNQTQRKVAPSSLAVPPSVETQYKDEGCQSGVDRRSSDLCAQWKAADAASDAAMATWYQFYLGIGGFLIGLTTLGAAVAAAIFARKAAVETEKGAQAALDAVAETREANVIARQLQRPWITISGYIIDFIRENENLQISIMVEFKNIGQTVANDIFYKCDFFHYNTAEYSVTQKIESVFRNFRGSIYETNISLMPGETAEEAIRVTFSFGGFEPFLNPVSAIISAAVYYRSSFNMARHENEVCFTVVGPDKMDAAIQPTIGHGADAVENVHIRRYCTERVT